MCALTQHAIDPLIFKAQVDVVPVTTAAQSVLLSTANGIKRVVVVPSPSLLLLFDP